MDNITKPFSQESFDASDALTRKYVTDYMLTKHGITFYNNSDRFGCDLIGKDGTLLEVEQKAKGWSGYDFQYPTIHFLHRKLKYVLQGAHFAMVNADFSRIAVITNSRLRRYCVSDFLKEISNSAVSEGECFYDIPTNQFYFDDLINDYKQQQNNSIYEIYQQIKNEKRITNN